MTTEHGALTLTRRGAVAAAIGMASMPTAWGAPAPLRGPVNVIQRRALIGRPGSAGACPAAVMPERDVLLSDFYTDPAYSVVDPDRLKRYQETVKNFGTFSVTVARLSDGWVATTPPQPAAASCTLGWLDRWASAGAMLGNVNAPNGEHERKWALAGAAQAYLKIWDAPGLDRAAKQRVQQWFGELAAASRAYYAHWTRASYNNHIYWLALALIATAVSTDERALFGTAVEFYRMALDDIAPDGTLPLEMGRKGRAFSYHVFSLIPLVMIAEFGAANGMDLYGEKGGALHRLARKVQDGLVDMSWFNEHAGPQDDPKPAEQARNISWGEPYYARFPNLVLGQMVAARRPIFYHWLGGNVTDDFGSTALSLR